MDDCNRFFPDTLPLLFFVVAILSLFGSLKSHCCVSLWYATPFFRIVQGWQKFGGCTLNSSSLVSTSNDAIWSILGAAEPEKSVNPPYFLLP